MTAPELGMEPSSAFSSARQPRSTTDTAMLQHYDLISLAD
jgi:hypothetical protein